MKPEGIDGGMQLRPSEDFIETPEVVKELEPSDILREITCFLADEGSTDEKYIKEAEGHLATMRMVEGMLTDESERAAASDNIRSLEEKIAQSKKH